MRDIFKMLADCQKEKKNCMLVSVIAGSGSTPRGAGAHMLVAEGGKAVGTIGGGAVEYAAQQTAFSAIREGSSFLKEYRLSKNEIADLGMVCGGNAGVYFHFIAHDNRHMAKLAEGVLLAFDKCEDCILTAEYAEGGEWLMYLGEPKGKEAGKTYYSEELVSSSKVYIFGGGHVAQSLSPILKPLGFNHIIADDRESFCKRELFPHAMDTRLIDFTDFLGEIKIKDKDYAVIVTRGHNFDFNVAAQALKTPACYIGMIGSRAKRDSTYKRLYELGFTKRDTNRIHSPIGIAIGAETPEEISLSIGAELIKIRSGLRL